MEVHYSEYNAITEEPEIQTGSSGTILGKFVRGKSKHIRRTRKRF